MDITFTNVFYEETSEAAEKRLDDLRKRDKYPEVKAYIIQEGENSWRGLRKIRIPPPQPQLEMYPKQTTKKRKPTKEQKAGL